MPLLAKICGLNTPAAVAAAVDGGANYVGLVFYKPSPRCVTPEQAASLAAMVPDTTGIVGLFVDAGDAEIERVLRRVPLDMLQVHGHETPERVDALSDTFGLPVMKAIKIAAAEDLSLVDAYHKAADWLLFDAKPPKSMVGALPGGNAVSFDWKLLCGRRWGLPTMLSGGLNLDNLAEAVQISGTRAVDVSSGVEDKPGQKNPDKIAAFLEIVKGL